MVCTIEVDTTAEVGEVVMYTMDDSRLVVVYVDAETTATISLIHEMILTRATYQLVFRRESLFPK